MPIVIKDVPASDKQRLLEMALIENIQREDLNPMEAAAGYQRLVDEFHLKQDDIAVAGRQGSRDRRELPAPAEAARGSARQRRLRRAVDGPRPRHRRARHETDQRNLARDVVARGLSVRETEALVKKEIGDKRGDDKPQPIKSKKDVHTRAAEDQLRMSLGTPVEIKRKGKGGTIAISFTNETELQRLYEYLTEKK